METEKQAVLHVFDAIEIPALEIKTVKWQKQEPNTD